MSSNFNHFSAFFVLKRAKVMLYQITHPYLAIAAVFMCTFCVCGNVLVIFAVCRDPCLQRSVTNYYILSLAVADLLVGLVTMPFAAIHDVSDGIWIFGDLFCDIWYSIDIFTAGSSLLHLTAVSIDRYIAIKDPLNYSTRVTKRRSYLFIIFLWFISGIASFPIMLSKRWNREEQRDKYQCYFYTNENRYLIPVVILYFYLPLAIMSFVYTSIYRAAVKQTKINKNGTKRIRCKGDARPLSLRVHVGSKNHHHQTQLTDDESNKKDEPTGECNSNSNSSSDRYSIKRRFNALILRSNRNFAKFSREHKAAKTVGIVFGCFLFCWMPFFGLMTMYILTNHDIQHPTIYVRITNWIGWSNSCMTPMIYAIWSREHRRAYKRICNCCTRRREGRIS